MIKPVTNAVTVIKSHKTTAVAVIKPQKTAVVTAATVAAAKESDFCLQRQATHIAAGPSRNPADNFARRRAWRDNAKPIQPLTVGCASRPQQGQTRATLAFVEPITATPINTKAALDFWRAWLTHPTLQELNIFITPTYTGPLTLSQETTTLIGSFWFALYECAINEATLSPALRKLHICMEAAFDMSSSVGALRVPKITPEMADNFNYTDLGNPTLAGSLLFNMIGCDAIGYKYRINNYPYTPFVTLIDVKLPPCFLSMENYVFAERPLDEKWAEGYAVARTLRFLFPFAGINADPYTDHIPATVAAATDAERTACVVNLRNMKLGRIRRIWYDMMHNMDT